MIGTGSRVKGQGSRKASSLSTIHYSLSTAGAVIGLLLGLATIFLQTASARADALDSLKKTYASVQTVQANFSQKITIATLKRERESKGEFFYKRGKGFLWKYSAPSSRIFLYDGKAIWQAEDEKPFVTRDTVDKSKIQGSFLDLVDDAAKLDDYFKVQEAGRDKDGLVLLLTPKREGMLQSARLWADTGYLIKRIEITEVTGNVNVLSFSSTRMNKPLDDELFKFNPGKKEIVER